jgi:transcriptional regulator with XRE-family HTH domain
MTQQELADLCGVERAQVSHIEGMRSDTSLAVFMKMCEVLGLEPMATYTSAHQGSMVYDVKDSDESWSKKVKEYVDALPDASGVIEGTWDDADE